MKKPDGIGMEIKGVVMTNDSDGVGIYNMGQFLVGFRGELS